VFIATLPFLVLLKSLSIESVLLRYQRRSLPNDYINFQERTPSVSAYSLKKIATILIYIIRTNIVRSKYFQIF
jgi:hypothetical protein